MQMLAHEMAELNELLLGCTNTIQSMALFLNQAQDPELRDIIARHYAVHVQDYNMKVEFTKRQQGSTDQLDVPSIASATQTVMSASMQGMQPQPVQPEIQLRQLNDRAIATSYLLTLKRSGREYAWATFETSTSQLRLFLEDAFRMCSHQAYEVWQYMVRKGWYAAVNAPQQGLQTMGQVYREVPNHQPAQAYSMGGQAMQPPTQGQQTTMQPPSRFQ